MCKAKWWYVEGYNILLNALYGILVYMYCKVLWYDSLALLDKFLPLMRTDDETGVEHIHPNMNYFTRDSTKI